MTDKTQDDDIINLNPGPRFSQKGKQSSNTLYNTNTTKKDIKIRGDEKRKADNLQKIAASAREKYMTALAVYKQRTTPGENKYVNQTVVLADGTRGYVNNLGYFQKYTNEKATVGMNRCPPKGESIEASYAQNEVSLLSNTSAIGLSEEKNQYTSCGQEGKNIFVSSVVSKSPPATPLRCVNVSPDSMKTVKFPGNSDQNSFNYESCKRYAITNGYSYFGLQNYRSNDDTSICLVGNNYAEIAKGGAAKSTVSKVEVWNSSALSSSANTVRFRPLDVGPHLSIMNMGSVNTKHMVNALDDSSMIVGNRRINTGAGANETFSVKQVGRDVIITKIGGGGDGWNQPLTLPVFPTGENNSVRGQKLMNNKSGQRDLQLAYSDWRRMKIGNDIIFTPTSEIKDKPPPINYLKVHPTGQIKAYANPFSANMTPNSGVVTPQQDNLTVNRTPITVFSLPSSVPRDSCNELVGPLSIIGATYGANCPNNKAKDNNALERLIYTHDQDNNPDVFNFKITNRLVPQNPAPGCTKDLVVNYKCGDNIMPNESFGEHDFATINCNITRSEAGNPCTTELRLLGGDNARGLAGLELVMVSADKRENTVWQWYLSGPQTLELIEDITPADNDYLRNARYVGKMSSSQVELKSGEYAISNNGKLELRINESGYLAVYVRTNRSTCITTADGKKSTRDKNTAFVYSMPYQATNPTDVGMMGYVDRNGVLHPYKKRVYKPGKGYRRANNMTIMGANLPEQPVRGPTIEKCIQQCNNNNKCYGAVFEKGTGMCYLKDDTVLTQEAWASKDNILLERNLTLDPTKMSGGCNKYPLSYVDSVVWNAYPKGNPMSPDTKCDLQQFLQEPAIVELRSEWTRKQEEADKYAVKITNTTVDTMDDRYLQMEESNMNDASNVMNKIVYDNTMDNKLVKAIYPYGGKFPERKKIKGLDDVEPEGFTVATGIPMYNDIKENPQPRLSSPSQRARATQFRYIDGIVEDTESVVTEENYKFAMWSVAVIALGIVSFRLLRKLDS